MSRPPQSPKGSLDLTSIIVAARDLKPEESVSPDLFEVGQMPREFLSESILTPADLEVALGRSTIAPIHKGEPVFWHQLEGIGTARLASTIPKRRRAVLLEVGPEVALIGQNDRIDVLYTFIDPKARETAARVLLQSVVAIGTDCTPKQDRPPSACRSVALLLEQEEAALLALASGTGQITISLRNPEDREIVKKPAHVTREKLRDQGRQFERARKRKAAVKRAPIPQSQLEADPF